MNDITLSRLYRSGWRAEDFGTLRPDTVIVEPVRPPKQVEGSLLVAADQTVEIPGTMCLLFRVLAVGPRAGVDTDNLVVRPGDVCALRNAALDPLHPNGEALRIDAKHIFSIVSWNTAILTR